MTISMITHVKHSVMTGRLQECKQADLSDECLRRESQSTAMLQFGLQHAQLLGWPDIYPYENSQISCPISMG